MITRQWLVDTAERVGLTAVEGFCGNLVLASTGVLSLSAVHSAEAAGVSAGLAALKAAIASLIPSTVSPASLAPAAPASAPPPPPVKQPRRIAPKAKPHE